MHLSELLARPLNQLTLDHPRICFKVEETYPVLFFSMLMKRARENDPIVAIDPTEQADALAKLESTFLGMTQRYWLGHIDGLSKIQQKEWKSYLEQYQGPNQVLYAVTTDQELHGMHVVIPNQIDQKLFKTLAQYFVHDQNALDMAYVQELFNRVDLIDIDTACLLIQYMQVMGARSTEFFDQWLQKLVIPQRSFFSLSQHFFAKQRSSFLVQWHAIRKEYPEQFWIAYWSEQLWRAACYIDLMRQKKFAEAKKIGFRLPFSFLQKDYRLLKQSELIEAHNWLYTFDYNLKHGADENNLHLFFYRFLGGTFGK